MRNIKLVKTAPKPLWSSSQDKPQQANDNDNDCESLYQDAQAGGVEWRSEVDDSAPGRVDREGGDGHVGRSAQQVSDQPRPASRPTQGTVLPITHDVEVKGKAHVLCQLLQQVDTVAVAALPQVLWQL